MWAHYANNFKGYCVEYRYYELIRSLEQLNPKEVYRTKEVKYNEMKNFSSISCIELLEKSISDPNKEEDVILKAICTKLITWEEEKEVRIISSKLGANNISASAITKIYISSRCQGESRTSILNYCKENKITLVEIKFHANSYQLGYGEILKF